MWDDQEYTLLEEKTQSFQTFNSIILLKDLDGTSITFFHNCLSFGGDSAKPLLAVQEIKFLLGVKIGILLLNDGWSNKSFLENLF